VLSEREAIKKTTQALRDCNRQDREGYADGVAVPTDVERSALFRAQSGLTTKQLASQLACRKQQGSISPSVEHAAEWLQKQRTADEYHHLNEVTPNTSDEMQEDSAATSLLSMAPHDYYTHSHTYSYYSTETDDVVEAAAAAAASADTGYSDMSAHEAACLLTGDDGL
jgi:hypothetical protein